MKTAKTTKTRVKPAPITGSSTQAPRASCTRLLCLAMPSEVWLSLSTATRRMLRVPILWRKGKRGLSPVRLQWTVMRTEAFAYAVEGSEPLAEILAVLSAAEVTRYTLAPFQHLLRRVPAGAVLTDPGNTGTKADVELTGIPMLVRTRRGRWKRYEIGGATWPRAVQEDLGEHVAPVEGSTVPARVVEPNRFVLEEGAKLIRGTKWERTSAWPSLAAARAAGERAAVTDALAGRTVLLRVVDRGTGTVLCSWASKTRKAKLVVTRTDVVAGVRARPVVSPVSLPGDAS